MTNIQPSLAGGGSYWRQAMKLVQGTLPMLAVRMAVYAAFFLLSVLWFAIWGGLAWLFYGVAPIVSWVFILIALGVGGGAVWFARRYLLYMVKGAHIAAMTDLLRGREIPSGFAQLSYGRAIIQKYFRDASLLFGLEVLIDGTLRAISNTVINITQRLPLPSGASSVVNIIMGIFNRSLSYIDEAILSYAIYREEQNVWNSARHGIVLYGQSYKPILFTAAKIYAMEKIFFAVTWLLLMVPGYFLLALATEVTVAQVLIFVGIVVAAYLIELALFEPFALAYVMVTYHNEIAGKTPDPTWDQRLLSVSSSFRQLAEKAKEKFSGTAETATAPPNVIDAPNAQIDTPAASQAIAGDAASTAPAAAQPPAPEVPAVEAAAPSEADAKQV
jgi:hypothetical protein